MKSSWLRWKAVAVVAFLMGLPLVEEAKASGAGGIVESSIALALSIIDVAGDS